MSASPLPVAAALRAWQVAALDTYFARQPRDFLAVATPGAGKTRFALDLAARLVADGVVQRITVVAPTEHLKRQWAMAGHQHGIALDPEFRNADGGTSRDYRGVVLTYAQVGMAPLLHRSRTEAWRTLVILDEIHHAGDALTWGDAVREAFEPATRRLALTGTPFRSDTNPIPFVGYDRDAAGALRSSADSSYGYGDALRDGVVRPVLFLAYSGEMRWRTSAGDEMSARLGEPLTEEQTAQAWRTALDPAGEWVPQVLRAADQRLTQVRAGGMPDAGGLVIATDHAAARAYAVLLRRICGEAPVVVLSDDPQASRKIGQFARSTDRWMVAVRMVSEGVDVPRLAVGVYATSLSTPLFFAQAVGRFVRARRRGETASVFVPSVPTLLVLAAELEAERDHVLQLADGSSPLLDDDLLAAAQQERSEPGEELVGFEALEASATFDRVLFDGAEFGTGAVSEEEQDFLGLPGLLEPGQVAALLRQRQARLRPVPPAAEPEPATTHETIAALRRELNGLVSAYHHRTSRPHGAIHAELRRLCGGPAVSRATAAELQERIEAIRRWTSR